MALALISKKQDFPIDLWRCEMSAVIPGLDIRVWPELGDERRIRMAVFDFNWAPAGIFQRMPNLGCIRLSRTRRKRLPAASGIAGGHSGYAA